MAKRQEEAKCAANYTALTPLSFIERTASVYGERDAVIYGDIRFTWTQTFERCRRLASAVSKLAAVGDTVSIVSPNSPALYEMHFGIPMAGMVLNAINFRLDARAIAVMLKHCEAKVVFVDVQYLQVVHKALQTVVSSSSSSSSSWRRPAIIVVEDRLHVDAAGGESNTWNSFLPGWGELVEYEDLLQSGDPQFAIRLPADDWETISLNYTSGTTARPKGVLYHHRGAYLNALVSVLFWGMKEGPVYLWTLPMFHCNGWTFTWGVAAMAGTNIIMRNMETKTVYDLIAKHRVTHLCGAPVVLNTITSAGSREKKKLPGRVHVLTGGAPPPPSVLSKMEGEGFDVMHSYGLTETYGPALVCSWKPEWNTLPLEARARLKARQGVIHLALQEADVLDPTTMMPVQRDGSTIGEVMLKGSTVMKGYLKDEEATRAAFKGGWFHTGDLGIIHPDGYIQIKDRSKDIIISGGENISSIEVESVLFKHPDILEAAVVARPDDHWGETPCAFVTLKDSASNVSAESIIAYCRKHLPRFYVPRTVIFSELPKTSTGKVQKVVLRERASALNTPLKSASKL
ncbi:unnamed protein product [Sphagnum compactum]